MHMLALAFLAGHPWLWGIWTQVRDMTLSKAAPSGLRRFALAPHRLTRLAVALVGVFLATPGDTQQGNLDAGKSAAQMFSDTCAACHRSPRELKRASASFLRGHYTTGAEEASVMANYLAGIPTDPRAGQSKRKDEAAKQQPADAAKQKQTPAEQAKAAQRGGRGAATAQARPVVEEKPPEPAPPRPALVPFEE
jgi:mono/diheme cytochrome c family protein